MAGKEIKVGDKVKIKRTDIEAIVVSVIPAKMYNPQKLVYVFGTSYRLSDGVEHYSAMRYEIEKLENPNEDELTKYKRAFEILKDKEIIKLGKNDFYHKYYLQRNDTNGNVITIEITKEEYELLEELMKGETSI